MLSLLATLGFFSAQPYGLALPPSQVAASAASPDVSTVVLVGRRGDGGVWKLEGTPSRFRWVEPFAPRFLKGGFEGNDLAVSRDGKRAAFLQGGSVRMYALGPVRLLATHRVEEGSQRVQWLPSGEAVLVTDGYEKTRLYNLRSAGASLPIHGPFAFPRGGQTVFGLARNGTVIEADLVTGRVRRSLRDGIQSFEPVVLSPDGRYLVTGGDDPNWKGPGRAPDGGALTESAYVHDLKLKVWDLRTGKRTHLLPGYLSTEENPEIVFDPAGHAVAIGLGRVLDLRTGKTVRKFEEGVAEYGRFMRGVDRSRLWIRQAVRLPEPPLWSSAAAFSADGSMLYLGGREGQAGTILAWDLRRGELIRRLAFPHPNVTFLRELSDGRLMASGGQYAWIVGPKGDVQRRVESPTREEFGIKSQEWISIDPVARRAYAAVDMGQRELAVLDVETGKVVDRRKPGERPNPESFSPNGARYVVYRMRAAEGGGVTSESACIDAATGKELWKREDVRLGAMSFSADGRYVVAGGSRTRLITDPEKPVLVILDAKTGETVSEVALPARAWKVRFTPDGREVCLTTVTGLEWRSASDLREVTAQVALGFPDATIGWALSPDNDLVAVSRPDSSVRLVSRKRGRTVAVLNALPRTGWVAWTAEGALRGSPDGLSLVRQTDGQPVRSATPPWSLLPNLP